MRISAVFALLLLILAAGFYFVTAGKRSALKRQEAGLAKIELEKRIKAGKKERKKTIEKMDALSGDTEVQLSILKGIKLELSFTGRKEGKASLSVQFTKPVGKVYVVDSLQYSCILYIDGERNGNIGSEPLDGEKRIMLEDGQYFGEWYFRELEIPRGSEIYIVWINHNPRTGETEELQSNKIMVE